MLALLLSCVTAYKQYNEPTIAEICNESPGFLEFIHQIGGKRINCNSSHITGSRQAITVLEPSLQDEGSVCQRYNHANKDRHGIHFLNYVRGMSSLIRVLESNAYEKSITKSVASIVRSAVQNSDSTILTIDPALESSMCIKETENSMKSMILDDHSIDLGERRWLLHPFLTKVSIGRSSGVYCVRMMPIPKEYSGLPKQFLYPPPGVFPIDAANCDWSFSADMEMRNSTAYVIDEGGRPVDISVDAHTATFGMYGLPTIRISFKSELKQQTYYILIITDSVEFYSRVTLTRCDQMDQDYFLLVFTGVAATISIAAGIGILFQQEKPKAARGTSPRENAGAVKQSPLLDQRREKSSSSIGSQKAEKKRS